MHILFITHYFPPNGGSTADQYHQLTRRLVARGHQVTVLTTAPHYPQGRIQPSYQGRPVTREQRAGAQVVYAWLWATPNPRISRRLLSQVSFMPSLLWQGVKLAPPDVAMIEAQPIFTGLAGRMLCRLMGVPYVLDVSDLWPDHLLSVGVLQEEDRVYKIAREMMDSGYRGAAHIVGLSPAWSAKIAAYLGDERKVSTIYRGVDLERFHPAVDTAAFRARHGLGDAQLITYISTFTTPYDIASMLQVAEHFEGREDVRVVFIGTGTQRDQVEAASERLSAFVWLPWVEHEDIPAAWTASRLNYWMLHDEALYRGTIPAKLFEAMGSGTPIVAANPGVCASIVEEAEAGLMTPPGDVAAIIDAMTQILDDDATYQRLSANARRYAEAHFGLEVVTSRYEAVLEAASGIKR